MKTQLSLVFALLLAIAGAGCGAAGDKNPANVSNDTNTVGGDSNGKDTTSVQTGALVTATAPQGILGDFAFDGTVTCSGVNTCEAQVTGSITVTFTCPNHLFLPKLVVAPKADTNVVWNQPGDWGLAPNGTYRYEQFQQDVTVKTYVVDQQIILESAGSGIGVIDGDKFLWNLDGDKNVGTVSVDLKTIVYHNTTASGSEFDITLTRIE